MVFREKSWWDQDFDSWEREVKAEEKACSEGYTGPKVVTKQMITDDEVIDKLYAEDLIFYSFFRVVFVNSLLKHMFN